MFCLSNPLKWSYFTLIACDLWLQTFLFREQWAQFIRYGKIYKLFLPYFVQTTDLCAKYVPSNLKIILNESFQCCNNYYSSTSFLFFMTKDLPRWKTCFRSFLQNHQIKTSRKVVKLWPYFYWAGKEQMKMWRTFMFLNSYTLTRNRF